MSTPPATLRRNIRELSAEEAQQFVQQLPPQQITPKPELRQFEGEHGLKQADPSQVPRFKEELDAYAKEQGTALKLVEQDKSSGVNPAIIDALKEAQALMQTQIQAGLDGIPTEEAGKPVVKAATVVSSPRPESHHHVTAETLATPAEMLAAEGVKGGGVPAVVGADVIGEAERIAGMLSSFDHREVMQGAQELKDFLARHPSLTPADLEKMGVKIPPTLGGKQAPLEAVVDQPAETQKEGENSTAPAFGGKETLGAAGHTVTNSKAVEESLRNQVQAGYEEVEQPLAAQAEEVAKKEAEFEKLKGELDDKLRKIQSTVSPSVINQNPQVREGIEDVVKNAEMQPTDENKVQALQTATLIADVELQPEKIKDGRFGRELAGQMQNEEFKDQASAFMRVQGELQNEGGSVDMPTLVAAAKTYGPQNEEELKRLVRELKAKEAKNLDLKEELGTADVRRNQPDAFKEMGEILDGADTTQT